MITFLSPLSWKNYVWGQWIVLQHNTIPKLVVATLALAVVGSWIIEWWLPLVFITIVFFIFVVVPAVKFLLARYWHQVHEIEYFFAKRNFGYTIGQSRVSMRLEALKSIEVKKRYLYLQTTWGGVPFIAQPEVIEKSTHKLRSLEPYKDLFIAKAV